LAIAGRQTLLDNHCYEMIGSSLASKGWRPNTLVSVRDRAGNDRANDHARVLLLALR